MLNFIRFILIISFIHTTFGQNVNFSQGEVTTKQYYTEIQYEFVKGKIIIPVIIAGKTYRFLLDTGAPNLITSQLKEQIIKAESQSISVKDANNNKNQMEVVTLPTLSIGNVSFINETALVYTSESNIIMDCFKVDGFIGSNLLRESVLQILPNEKKLIITNNVKKVITNKHFKSDLKLVGAQSSPYVKIHLKDKKDMSEYLLLDTGMDGFYDLCLKSYNLFAEENALTAHSEGEGSIGMSLFGNANTNNQFRLKIPELHLAGTTFNNVVTETTDDTNSRMGSELLDHGTVTIDFKKKHFYFEPFEKNVDLNEKLLGFSTTIMNNKPSVGIVWDDELLDNMHVGDEILSVNGIDFTTMEICDLLLRESIFKEFESFEIVLKNQDGDIKTINLTKQ